ncbi:MAG: glycosyltransferase family 2 protein [Clostridia bacterium]|nr:glycosyltransferase family 2 protein [Clostridia bacterium]
MSNKISVIIPAYQAERYLPEAVASVRTQNWSGNLEVIIVDDGSQDETYAIARQLGDTALTRTRGGAACARNDGIQASSGDFILLLDADDVLLPSAVTHLYAPFDRNPALAAVFGLVQDFVSPELSEAQREKLRVRPGHYGGILPGGSLIRRHVFDQIGGFDESLSTGGETVAWIMKLRDAGLPTMNLGEVVLKRRLHLTNTGRVQAKQEMQSYAAILRQRMYRR